MNKAQLAGTLIALPIILLLIGLLPVDGAADKSGEGNRPVSGPLDGLVFVGELGPEGKPRDVSDTFVFDNGNFVSKECELRCKFPPRPYFVRVDGARTEFISETKCPYKDAWITWRGTVEGDKVRGKATWVVKRWYWTLEDTYEFEASLVTDSAASANSD